MKRFSRHLRRRDEGTAVKSRNEGTAVKSQNEGTAAKSQDEGALNDTRGEERLRCYTWSHTSDGINVLTVVDHSYSISAAAISVNVGSMWNPSEVPGLAHCLEHVLFLCAPKPLDVLDLTEFDTVIRLHGGKSNGVTRHFSTTVAFEVDQDGLHDALCLLLQSLEMPELTPQILAQAVLEVDAEHNNRLEQVEANELAYLVQRTINEHHPLSKFWTGNALSLLRYSKNGCYSDIWESKDSQQTAKIEIRGCLHKIRESDTTFESLSEHLSSQNLSLVDAEEFAKNFRELKERIADFHKQYYIPERMCLVVVENDNFLKGRSLEPNVTLETLLSTGRACSNETERSMVSRSLSADPFTDLGIDRTPVWEKIGKKAPVSFDVAAKLDEVFEAVRVQEHNIVHGILHDKDVHLTCIVSKIDIFELISECSAANKDISESSAVYEDIYAFCLYIKYLLESDKSETFHSSLSGRITSTALDLDGFLISLHVIIECEGNDQDDKEEALSDAGKFVLFLLSLWDSDASKVWEEFCAHQQQSFQYSTPKAPFDFVLEMAESMHFFPREYLLKYSLPNCRIKDDADRRKWISRFVLRAFLEASIQLFYFNSTKDPNKNLKSEGYVQEPYFQNWFKVESAEFHFPTKWHDFLPLKRGCADSPHRFRADTFTLMDFVKPTHHFMDFFNSLERILMEGIHKIGGGNFLHQIESAIHHGSGSANVQGEGNVRRRSLRQSLHQSLPRSFRATRSSSRTSQDIVEQNLDADEDRLVLPRTIWTALTPMVTVSDFHGKMMMLPTDKFWTDPNALDVWRPPILIGSHPTVGGLLWLKQDTFFGVPLGKVTFEIRYFDEEEDSIALTNEEYREVLTKIWQEKTWETQKAAEASGYTCNISSNHRGLQVSVAGFTQHLESILCALIDALTNIANMEVDDEHQDNDELQELVDSAKTDRNDELEKFRSSKASESRVSLRARTAYDADNILMAARVWKTTDRENALKKVECKGLVESAKRLLQDAFLETLVVGNFSPDSAAKIAENLAHRVKFNLRAFMSQQWNELFSSKAVSQVLLLGEGTSAYFSTTLQLPANRTLEYAIRVTFQMKPPDPPKSEMHGEALLRVLHILMQKDWFEFWREHGVYTAKCELAHHSGISLLHMYAQSSEFSAERLCFHAERGFRRMCGNIKGLEEKELEKVKTAARTILLRGHHSIYEEHDEWREHMVNRNYFFTFNTQVIQALANINLKHTQKGADQLLHPKSRRMFVVCYEQIYEQMQEKKNKQDSDSSIRNSIHELWNISHDDSGSREPRGLTICTIELDEYFQKRDGQSSFRYEFYPSDEGIFEALSKLHIGLGL